METREIKVDGKQVSLKLGKESVIAETGPEYKYSFLVHNIFNMYGGIGPGSSTGRFIVIPMKKVEELNKKYGGFQNWSRCNSPGEAEGKSCQPISIVLVAQNPKIEKQIEEFGGFITRSPLAQIEITGSRLKIKEQTFSGMSVTGLDQMEYYLISDFKIVMKHYQ